MSGALEGIYSNAQIAKHLWQVPGQENIKNKIGARDHHLIGHGYGACYSNGTGIGSTH